MMQLIMVFLVYIISYNSVIFAEQKDIVLGICNGKEIKFNDLAKKYRFNDDEKKKFLEYDTKEKEAMILAYITEKLVLDEAKNKKLDSSVEFENKLDLHKYLLLRRELVQEYVDGILNDSMIQNYYKKAVDLHKNIDWDKKVCHILVDDEKTALEISKKLKNGLKFDVLAKEYSKDELTRLNSGELGYFFPGTYFVAVDQILHMNVGEISDPIKTHMGWHIFKITDKRKHVIPSLVDVREEIVQQIVRDLAEEYINSLLIKANVEVFIKDDKKK